MQMGKTLALAGNQSTAIDVLRALAAKGFAVDYVLTVGPEKAPLIADYQDVESAGRTLGCASLRAATYEMNDEATRSLLQEAPIDLLISVGWQRLFPAWLLERIPLGTYGMHGSSQQLPRGRGRSPMNWSIIEDRTVFYTSLFRYDADVDSGPIVGTQAFDIRPWDTIRSLQHKNALAQLQLLLEHLPRLLDGTAAFTRQPDDVEPTYYPKRVPDDGVVDWRDSAARIDRIVRAVARPYPGAFTFQAGRRINVNAGGVFDTQLCFAGALPGEIVAAFNDGTFVVQCGEHSYYVTDWEGAGWTPAVGMILESKTNASWEKLARMQAATK